MLLPPNGSSATVRPRSRAGSLVLASMLRSCTSAPFATCTFRICSWTNSEPGGVRPRRSVFLWLAIDPLTKIIPALELGPRTQKTAHVLIHSLRQCLAAGCLPLFTSDGLNLYFYATRRPFW